MNLDQFLLNGKFGVKLCTNASINVANYYLMMMFRRIPADLFENAVILMPELFRRSQLLKSLSLLLVRVVLNSLLGCPLCIGLIHRGRLLGLEEDTTDEFPIAIFNLVQCVACSANFLTFQL